MYLLSEEEGSEEKAFENEGTFLVEREEENRRESKGP